MKAILVIDMPTDCIKCPLADGYCWNIFPTKGIADGCPLRPLPKYRDNSKKPQDYAEVWIDGAITGWNACLDEITGETE